MTKEYAVRAVGGEAIESFLNEMGTQGYVLLNIQPIAKTVTHETQETTSGSKAVIKETSFNFLTILEREKPEEQEKVE